MPNVLIADGTPAVWQAERAGFGIPSNFSLFAAAVQLHHPGIRATPLNIADGEGLPFGIATDYRTLDAEPTRRDLIWRYGIASEIMDPIRRTTEIGNWLRTVVEPRRFVA